MKIPRIVYFIAVVLLSSTGNLAAYELMEDDVAGKILKWRGNSLTFHVDNATIPENSSPWWNGVETAVWNFNHNPSNFSVAITPTTTSVGFGNDRSEIWTSGAFSHQAATYPLAIYYPIVIPFPPFVVGYVVNMHETDIVINDNPSRPWTSSAHVIALREYGNIDDNRSLPGTVLHEMGHAAGLGHVNYEYNIMGLDCEHVHVNGTLAFFYLGEDASRGLMYLYGLHPDNREDVGVVHWKYHQAAGDYSDHTRTVLSDTSNNVLPADWVDYTGDGVDDDQHYRVNPGQRVRVEFTYENNGAHAQDDVAVGFYLSDDSIINTQDTRIGGTSIDLPLGHVQEARHDVTLPTSMVSGQRYWIGAIVDESDNINENMGFSMEWNNATYIPIVVN